MLELISKLDDLESKFKEVSNYIRDIAVDNKIIIRHDHKLEYVDLLQKEYRFNQTDSTKDEIKTEIKQEYEYNYDSIKDKIITEVKEEYQEDKCINSKDNNETMNKQPINPNMTSNSFKSYQSHTDIQYITYKSNYKSKFDDFKLSNIDKYDMFPYIGIQKIRKVEYYCIQLRLINKHYYLYKDLFKSNMAALYLYKYHNIFDKAIIDELMQYYELNFNIDFLEFEYISIKGSTVDSITNYKLKNFDNLDKYPLLKYNKDRNQYGIQIFINGKQKHYYLGKTFDKQAKLKMINIYEQCKDNYGLKDEYLQIAREIVNNE